MSLSANIYDEPETVGLVQDPIVLVVIPEFVGESEIEACRGLGLSEAIVEAREAVHRQTGLLEIVVAVPDDLDENDAALEKHLVALVWLWFRLLENVLDGKNWTVDIFNNSGGLSFE